MEVIFQTYQHPGTEKPEITTPTHAAPVLEVFAGNVDFELRKRMIIIKTKIGNQEVCM